MIRSSPISQRPVVMSIRTASQYCPLPPARGCLVRTTLSHAPQHHQASFLLPALRSPPETRYEALVHLVTVYHSVTGAVECVSIGVRGIIRLNIMDDSDYNFRYFREPCRFSSYSFVPHRCEICGFILPGYEGPFYGDGDIDFVCEPCLAGGRLSKNTATALIDELTRFYPNWDETQISQTAKQRAVELEQRTPLIQTWQPFLWPSHCGDYCCYLREAGKADFDEIAPDGQGQEFFAQHLNDTYKADTEFVREIWGGIQPGKSPNQPLIWPQGAYLFQCLVCSRYIIDWDCDRCDKSSFRLSRQYLPVADGGSCVPPQGFGGAA